MQNKQENQGRDVYEDLGIAPSSEARDIYSELGIQPTQTSQSTYKELASGNYHGINDFLHALGGGYLGGLRLGGNALFGLAGQHPFNEPEEPHYNDLSSAIAHHLGKGGAYLTLAAPAIAASEASVPGLLGASIGSGLAGYGLTQGNWKERLPQAVIDAAIPGALKAVKTGARLGKSYLTSTNPNKIADLIQNAHDIHEAKATGLLKEVSSEAKNRNLARLKLDESILSTVRAKGSKSNAFKDLVNKAEEGDYDAVRKVSSDLKKQARTLTAEDKSFADQDRGKILNEEAHKIDTSLYKHLLHEKHPDLTSKLAKGLNEYRKLMEQYYEYPIIAKLVGKKREASENLPNFIGKRGTYHEQLRQNVPGLKKIAHVENDKKTLAKLGKQGLGHLGIYEYLKYKLTDKDSNHYYDQN